MGRDFYDNPSNANDALGKMSFLHYDGNAKLYSQGLLTKSLLTDYDDAFRFFVDTHESWARRIDGRDVKFAFPDFERPRIRVSFNAYVKTETHTDWIKRQSTGSPDEYEYTGAIVEFNLIPTGQSKNLDLHNPNFEFVRMSPDELGSLSLSPETSGNLVPISEPVTPKKPARGRPKKASLNA